MGMPCASHVSSPPCLVTVNENTVNIAIYDEEVGADSLLGTAVLDLSRVRAARQDHAVVRMGWLGKAG